MPKWMKEGVPAVDKGIDMGVLCFSGQMDTVPFNSADWTTDPLQLTLLNEQ